MVDREFRPHQRLAPFVQLYWALESDDPAAFGESHRIFPDGIVEVVFHYGDPFVTRFGNGREEIEPRIFAISQTSRFIDIRPTGRLGLVSVRFFPWGAYHFFRIPVSEFADRQISAEFLWGRPVRELEDRIQSAANLEARVRLIERFLLGQLQRHHHNDGAPEVSRLIRHVWERSGRIEIRAMARQFGVSQRQLERRFLRATGAPPKQIARIARFLAACRQITLHSDTLTQIALNCGYYDQAHFIREFKGFSGLTPGQLPLADGVSFLKLD